jgi:hypothetical protein
MHSPQAGIPGECPVQDITADRDCWFRNAGEHYREVAHWLRGVAARCRVANPQRELLDLARRYERRADRFDTGWR